MNINNDDILTEQYAIISYSHEKADAVVGVELKVFEKYKICYWFDENMNPGKNVTDQYIKIMDNKNCKGAIFFVSDSFLLSPFCAKEMHHFKDKYGVDDRDDKFCLFVMPKKYPYKDFNAIRDSVKKYADDKMDAETQERLKHLDENIELFLELNQRGDRKFVELGDAEKYVKACMENGMLFNTAGIIYGHKDVTEGKFGYFPQTQNQDTCPSDITKRSEKRKLDSKPAFYRPMDWFILREDEESLTLLSKKLLFSIDYLSLMYPFKKDDKTTIEEHVKDTFFKYFEPKKMEKDEDGHDANEIFSEYLNEQGTADKKNMKVRFLKDIELEALVVHYQNNQKKEILMPEATYFAKTTKKDDALAFWLAVPVKKDKEYIPYDVKNARRVDSGIEGLSNENPGVEPYYVRIVLEITKPKTEQV